MAAAARQHLLSIVCLAAAALLAVAAVADHEWKGRRMDRAQVREWFCANEGTRCGGPSSVQMETNWERRQWAYEVAVVALGGLGVASAAYRLTWGRGTRRGALRP